MSSPPTDGLGPWRALLRAAAPAATDPAGATGSGHTPAGVGAHTGDHTPAGDPGQAGSPHRLGGVYRVTRAFDADRADAVAAAAGWAHWLVDGPAATKAELLDAFAAGCHFPAWFGRNYDALADSLRDLDLPAGRGALVWATAHTFAAAQPAAWPTVRSILEGAVQFRREYGERFLVVCVGPTLPGLPDL